MGVDAGARAGPPVSAEPSRDRERSFGYRAHLDGLRVVAVYLVVLFHAGSERFSGGFVGVDVFFVLSGFLVTHVLLRDLDGAGSIGFRRFYARRFRRLLPAAAVVLLVSALVYSALASPLEVAEAEGGFRAAFLYWTNWYFIGQSNDYFAADLATNPVLHFWSLAVEEQFYLLWPLLLGGLFAIARRFGARSRRVLWGLVAAGAASSLVWAWLLNGSDPVRAFYGTDARAYQLLAGALVALSPGLLARLGRHAIGARVVAVGALVGLVVVATSAVALDPVERGMAATLAAVVVIVALEAAVGGPARWALSRPPVVYLGRISYGTYLWHWPVVWVMARSFDLSVGTTIALTALIATALASLSYELLEQPVRASPWLDRRRTLVIASGLTISVVGAVVLIPRIVDRADPAVTAALGGPELATTGFTPVPADLDVQAIFDEMRGTYFPTACEGPPPEGCTRVQGSGAHVLLVGDSHAAMMVPALRELALQNDLTLSVAVRPGCPWQRGLGVSDPAAERLRGCLAAKEVLYDELIPALDPDLVVVMNGGYEISPDILTGLQYTGPDGEVLEPGSPELEDRLEQTTRTSLDQLRAGRDVVVLEPVPLEAGGFDPLGCLSEAEVVEACRFVVDPEPTEVERLYRSRADAADDVWSLDLDPLVCPFLPICDPIVDRLIVKADESHLTREFATSLAPALEDYLKSNGILP
jgi:peptidoglycan/LPS O-acetylase OafA/YrhL